MAHRSRSPPAIALVLLLVAPVMPVASAATPLGLVHAGGGIVFTFNDGLASGPLAAQTLEAYGFVGTFYVTSTMLRQGPYYAGFMSTTDVANLSVVGHDIESMTATHQDLTTLSPAQLQAELADSKSALQNITGKPVTQLAYPYGAVDDPVATATATYFASGRVLTTSITDFAPSVDAYHLPGLVIGAATTLATAQSYVDYAAANDVYVMLSLGAIVTSPGAYDWSPSDLDALAAYVRSKGMPVITVAQLVAGGDPPAPTAPGTPTLAASGSNGVVNLSWSTPSHGGSPITGYRLYRGATSGNETLYATLGVQGSFSDTSVTNGNAFYYQVSAVNAIGEGNRSTEVAATPGAPSGSRIVFTFDNGYASGTVAAQVLEAYGYHATFYASSGLLRQGPFWTAYLSADDLVSLTNRGHDVESMTVDQRDLTTLNASALAAELALSQSALQTITGRSVRHLAYPYGSVNTNVANATALRYDSGRTLTLNVEDFATPPMDRYHQPALLVLSATSLATAETFVDLAITHNTTVVLAFGNIVTNPGTYDWTPSDLDALAAYVQSKAIGVVTMAQLMVGAPPSAPTVPGAPTLRVAAGNALVNLSWTVPDNHGSPITGYAVYRGTTSGNEVLYATLGAEATYADANTTNGVTYYYKVGATNTQGDGALSNEASAKPNPFGLPSGAIIVFTFDDGDRSQLAAVPTLDKYGFKATFNIMSRALRQGKANPDTMSSTEVRDLSRKGHDIEAHSVNEIELTNLSLAQAETNMRNAQSDLRSITGKAVNYMAWPGGAHNAQLDAIAAKYYKASRVFSTDIGLATAHTTNVQAVPAMGVLSGDSAAKAKSYVDYAISNNRTVILAFHNLAPVPSSYGVTPDAYDWNLAAFKELVAYTAARHVPVMTFAQLGTAGRLPPN
ncbi:MAG: polysaccharide deacetylase family protein [Candidatus Thermoplasmatota archaeon]